MKKRVLSMFMALALCLTLLPAPVRAAEDTPESGAIVQEEQEEATPAISEQAAENGIAVQDGRDSTVSEQAGTNEDENGAEGGRQNTDTPDAGGAEDSKADAPESGEDENAGNNADAAVSAVQTMIDALPIVSELDGMTADELDAAYDDIQAAYDAYEALNAEQQAQITGADFEALLGWFNSQTALLADAQSGEHTHCVCGKDSGTTVNGHTHNTSTAWTAADSLPGTAGSYYLTQSVSSDWTVPTGEVNLCLNGQTISGKITVGSDAKLTLTDCTGTGKLQGSRSGSGVSINGGTFNLYGGTITGFVNGVEIGSHNNIQTGSSFTMYGGAITGNKADSSGGGGVFLIGTTNSVVTAPSFTMHGGTISNNTAGASDGGGGGVYVGVKCSFTMDGGTITGNTATAGNGGGIYIHFNAGKVSISGGTITGNKATATGNISCGHGGGIYSERGVTVGNVKITGNNSTFEGGGIYGKGAITLTNATVTDNNRYDVYYDGKESTTPELTVSGSVKAGYYANYAWKLPILVSGALSEDSVIRVGVREGKKPGYGGSLAIAEPASGVTLRAENFKADAADSVTSLGEDGKVYLSLCNHEMDDTGYTCKKCHTQFDVRIGEGAYYQTLREAFLNARDGSTITLMRDVNLNEKCFASNITTLDLHGKTITSGDKFFNVNKKLTVKDSSEGGGTQALNVKFSVVSNGTLAVDDSYTGDISYVALYTGGTLEAYTGTIQELRLEKDNGTGYSVKLWKDNAHCCTVKTITLAENADQNLTVGDLLKTNHAKCELYGEQDGTWSIVDKSTKIVNLTGYTAYKVQFAECVHQCDNDTVKKPVCSKCGKVLVVKIKATASDGTIKTAWFPADSGIENGDGYVEAIQTLNGWSAEGYTDATLMPLCDVHDNRGGIGIAQVTLTGKLAVDGGEHLIYSTTIAAGADVTFKTGRFYYITVNGKASFVGGTYLGGVTASSGAEAVFSGGAYQYLKVTDGGTAVVKNSAAFGEDAKVTKGTLTVEGGSFGAAVVVERDGTMNVNGGSFTGTGRDKVTYENGAKGTISGGSFADLYLYGSGTVWLAGGSFTKLTSSAVLSSLLTDGAAYYDQSGNAISNSGVSELNNVTVKTHTHTVDEQTGICSVCHRQMAASLTVGGTTSWYTAFATAIEAANAADSEKTITLYQDVDGYDYDNGQSTTYELTRGPVTLATGGKTVKRANLTAKGISLTVTGSNGDFNVTVDGKDAELTVNDGNTKLAIVTAQNGGKLSLSNGTFSRVAVKGDGSSASLSGGSYDEITSDDGYVKPYALLAEGYAYKKTADNEWLPNANSISSTVTVEKAPFAVEKIYPDSDTDYTGNSAFATDGNITLTAVIAPETEGVTYYYWWELFNESTNDWTITFRNVNTATHTGGQSKTLTISGLPTDKSYQYRILVQCSNGYNCYSEPFTVNTCAHDGNKTLQYDETYHWYVCGKCGAEFDRAEHSGGTATCTAKAVCSTCKTAYGKLGDHTLTKHDAVDATCTAPGNVEYWHCSVCGKNFSDSEGKGELTEITSPALNHKWGKWTSNGNGTHTRTCQRDSRHTETENCSGGSATCTNAAICTSCGGYYGKELGHDWGEWKNTGNAQQHIRTCKRDQSHTETAAHTPGTPANCTTPQTCTACGYEITPANNNHDWNAWESNGNGTHTHTCKNNSSHTETTNCSGGSATCEARAVCDVCHMVYGELAPHTLTHTPAVDATCTTPGNVEYWHCSVCGKNFSDSEGKGELTEITTPALNHNWGAWEKVSETQHQRICQNDDSHKEIGDHTPGTAATCKAPANCSICGQSYGEKNPSNHTGGTEVRNQKEATCKKEGYTGDTYCKDCGEKLATGTATVKKAHTVGTPATCVSKAVCSVCSETFGEVDATNHVHTTVKNRKEATCTQTGYAGDTYCTDCDKLLSTGKELAALGHDYKATVTKQPTTTEEGIRTYTCTRCNSSYTESIAKLPEEQHTHNYTGSITKEATCTEAGVRTYTCSCGDSYTENIPATGHSYVSKVTKAATTTEEGIMTYTCSKCGHSYTQPIAKIKSDDSSKDNGSQNQKPQTGTDNGNQNQKPQPDTDNGNEKGDSIKPYIKDDSGKEGWDVIKPQLEEAKAGDTVTVAMNGTTVVPKDVIDSIKGKDTTLVLDMGNGLSWKIYGKDITDAAGDIDFDVTVGADAGKSIPVDVINNVTGEHSSLNLTLAYDGEFGFTATLTVNMESKNAGLYANLFYYNEQTGELEFISAGQIDPDGNVELVFTHASDYTIVVDAKIMSDNGQADNKSDETIPAPKTDDSTSKYAWNNTIIIIIGICIILIVFGAVFYVRKKSGSEEE